MKKLHTKITEFAPLICVLVTTLLAWSSNSIASGGGSYQFPTPETLKALGLEEIPGYSNPYNEKNEIEQRKFLRLGPVKSAQKQCVTLLKLLDRQKACTQIRCKGLFPWGERKRPLDGQFVLLSQPCRDGASKVPSKQSTLLFANQFEEKISHFTDRGVDMRLTTHVIGLSPDRYIGEQQRITWRPIESGAWSQIIEDGQYKIEFQTEASEGILAWHPKKGFLWDETEP